MNLFKDTGYQVEIKKLEQTGFRIRINKNNELFTKKTVPLWVSFSEFSECIQDEDKKELLKTYEPEDNIFINDIVDGHFICIFHGPSGKLYKTPAQAFSEKLKEFVGKI